MPAKKKAAAKSPAKAAAKPAAKKAAKSEGAKANPVVDELIARRDKLLAAADTEEKKLDVHMLMKGMYKCAKEEDADCLKKISDNLTKVGGKARRSRSRSKSRSRKH